MRFMILLSAFSVFLLLGTVSVHAVPLAKPSSVPSAAPLPSDLNGRLKAAMFDAQKTLGQMDPWQKRLFDEEVMPQALRFIKDYRNNVSADRVEVEIDFESLRNYLRFYAPVVLAKVWGKGSPSASIPASPTPLLKDLKILTYLRADSNCTKCVEAEKNLRQLVKSRLELRGFTPVWLTSEELGSGVRLMGKLLDEKVAEQAKAKNFAGAFVLDWAPVPVDDIESAHADENHYFIHSFILIRDLAKLDGRMELMDTDTFETSTARLLTDAFTEVGLRSASVQSDAAQTVAKEEVLLEITGVKDFAQYTKLKNLIFQKMKGIATFEEREIARSRMVWVVVSSLSKAELEKQLNGISVGGLAPGMKMGIK